MRRTFFLAYLLFSFSAFSQTIVDEKDANSESVFPMVTNNSTNLLFDSNDFTVIKKTASIFNHDVEMVTGKQLIINNINNKIKTAIIYGTIEKSRIIQQIINEHKIDVSKIRGKWEQYLIATVKNPIKGIDKGLVIAGSDRRGAAYGLFKISEIIGVNPWYWWADVPVKKRTSLYIKAPEVCSSTPSVKYRGIFINDEDWGMQPWAAKNFEKERGNIGPRTYAKICELLLRLKANYLCPAMHPVSTPFNAIPENKLVADSFAIVMGSTHCEPLLLNTAREWDKSTMGPWDYDKNKQGILNVLDKRVKNNARYENVWTLALRGLHDAAMGVGVPMKDKVKMLQEALLDQRHLLAKNIQKPIEEIPQAFTPYKEVLDIYSNGLELPDDITIIWADDNYGYFKRLSNPDEQKRSGRSGVYYHISYLGVPHSYLWFSTTPTAFMYEELSKAYATTADRVWLLNCGDIKGCEAQISFFLAMAYDTKQFNSYNANLYMAKWLANIFGNKYLKRFEDLTINFNRLAFQRKPEYMGWGYWNNSWDGGEKRTDTEFSFSNYDEANHRIEEYKRLGIIVDQLYNEIPSEAKSAMYQLAYYPIKGSEYMNRMTFAGQLYRKYVNQQRTENEKMKIYANAMLDSLKEITLNYNNLNGGKWKYMMSLKQNYDGTSSYFELPIMQNVYIPEKVATLGVETESEEISRGGTSVHILPTFSKFMKTKHWLTIYNKGMNSLTWEITTDKTWIQLSQNSGTTQYSSLIKVAIDWNRVPAGERINGIITINAGKQSEKILVSVFNPIIPSISELNNMYIEYNGYVSMPAIGFQRKFENNEIKIDTIPGLGIDGKVLRMGNPLSPLQMYRSPKVPRVEYDFYTFNSGMVDVYTYVLPTFPLHSERDYKLPENTNSDTKYSICIDGGSISTPSTSAIEYSQIWYDSILRNCRINKSTLYVDKPGMHTLQIRCGDPGIMIQKIIIDLGGLKKSYMGPPSTYIRKFIK